MLASELHIPPDERYVGLARLLVTSAARLSAMSEERVEDLRIAVSEATTNAILAHRRSQRTDPVVLQFGLSPDKTFQVTVMDTGPGFAPQTREQLSVRDWAIEGGLGVTIIRGLADDVDFLRGDGMKVHMRFEVDLMDSRVS